MDTATVVFILAKVELNIDILVNNLGFNTYKKWNKYNSLDTQHEALIYDEMRHKKESKYCFKLTRGKLEYYFNYHVEHQIDIVGPKIYEQLLYHNLIFIHFMWKNMMKRDSLHCLIIGGELMIWLFIVLDKVHLLVK